jgi:hypothetical protein
MTSSIHTQLSGMIRSVLTRLKTQKASSPVQGEDAFVLLRSRLSAEGETSPFHPGLCTNKKASAILFRNDGRLCPLSVWLSSTQAPLP